MSLLQYNTNRKYLGLREYGRHIQAAVDYLLTIEDREKRNQQAKAVIELMGSLNPHLQIIEDYKHMLWDHLFAISDFTLDVDSPYSIPQRETYKKRGEPMKYPRRYPKFAHLGKNLELIIDRALNEQDEEKKAGFANSIAYYMKLTYSNWHNELVHDDTIRNELNIITKGELEFSSTPNIRHNRHAAFERDDFNKPINGNVRTKPNFGNTRDTSKNNSNGRNNGGARTEGRGGKPSSSRGGERGGDNRTSSQNNRSNTPNRNFKKRF